MLALALVIMISIIGNVVTLNNFNLNLVNPRSDIYLLPSLYSDPRSCFTRSTVSVAIG